MLLTFYSFLMATIASTLMIIVIYIFKKTRYFHLVFNVPFVVLLYVLSLSRIFIPLELPNFQAVIQDEYVLPPVMDLMENRSELTKDLPILFMDIVGIVLTSVSVVLILVFVIRQTMYTKKLKRLENLVTEHELELFCKASEKVFKKDRKIKLIKTDFVSMPMVTGLFSNMVLLPNEEYDDNELEFIFIHECTHLKNKDLLLKLLIHVFCCIFWWNPFVYLLKSDISFLLELKCDNKACADMDELTKLDYIKSINDNAIRLAKKKSHPPTLVSSGFAFADGTKRHVFRMNNLLFPKTKTKSTVVYMWVLSLFLAAIWVLSFVIIWQPSYPLTKETHPEIYEEEGYMSDETNAYLVQQEDGNYIFYFDGMEIPVPQEEFDAGGYEIYPIYDEPQ